MENQALISVIIPVYNVETYLRECVDSVLKQTYQNFEIILVDDGSTDSSGDICDEYAGDDERICVIHQKNGGLSVARNTGLAEAKGKYIYFLDSDDYIDETALKKLFDIAEKNNSDIVFFDAVSFADTDDFTVKQNYIRKHQYNTTSGYDAFCGLILNKEYHSAVPLLFIRRMFLLDSDVSFVPDTLYEDMIFSYQLFCKATKVSQCREALYSRRYRKNSIMTSSKSKKHFISCTVVLKYNSEFTDNLTFDKKIPYEYVVRCAFNVFNVYEKLNRTDKKTCKKELRKIKKEIISQNAFNDQSLKMRCYGKAFWFVYKIFEKTVGRLMKGTK